MVFDSQRVAHRFGQAAMQYDQAAFLQKDMIDELLCVMDSLELSVDRLIDMGCGTGNAFGGLSQRFFEAEKTGLDLAFPMLQAARIKGKDWRLICADMNRVPVAEGYYDLVFSSAAIQWSNDTEQSLAEWHRILKPGGWLCLASFGEKTLWQLKESFAKMDQHDHVHPFVRLACLNGALAKQGFFVFLQQQQVVTQYHQHVYDLLRGLKKIGAANALKDRARGLMGKRHLLNVEVAYEKYRQAAGFPADWEIILTCCQKC